VTFEAKIQVTSFEPKSGSQWGGSLITIGGATFSDNPQDNPVKVGYKWVGGVNHYCYVKETSETEIKCRIATDYLRAASPDANSGEDLIVFASTYEEATFADGLDRKFVFVADDTLPSLTNYAVTFNSDFDYIITITGTDITDTDVNDVYVYFGGDEVETKR
jgi:hypothetical protein